MKPTATFFRSMDQANKPRKIVFEGEQFHHPRSFQTSTPRIVALVIKCSGGRVKDEKHVSYFLIGFLLIAIAISLFFIFSGGVEIPPEALENPEYGLPEVD